MKISEHISLTEATKSQTGTRLGLENIPNEKELAAMRLVAEKVFEPLRIAFGKPITISSFYRSYELNILIGGAAGSQHEKGEAMDLDVDGFNAEIFHWIKNNLEFDQLIWEFGNTSQPDWVHVSYSKDRNRNQVLRVVKEKGANKYIKFDL